MGKSRRHGVHSLIPPRATMAVILAIESHDPGTVTTAASVAAAAAHQASPVGGEASDPMRALRVWATNLDPVLDWSLCDGAVRCLQLVLSLAGGAGRPFVTLTSSIARQLGRTARTVQNYWNQLAGKTGLVTVTKAVEPPPEKPAIWPRLPSPKGTFRRAPN
jgi:hypothetical protein